ncbi:GNAT family N-acetyltransferase [Qipengyuania sp. S6317L1]|uniref:GNAT family N-acetyltransferase n=1 Tax=Qipengyuania sp. S6317L1 TaxID=2926410 RepID=UPI001FF4BFAE|nr:GNAT family N-acetyltransferase [Qipengyuania sp. S6317L1]MCK0098707.1 GNAT family N-acetyltransferase [Qipengyuania sp. S6317L1]
MPISVEREPSPEDADALSQGIVAFNKAGVPDLEKVEDEVRFFVLAKDDEGALQGGIRAVCYWNTLHIELLWLDETARGSGLGAALLSEAEDFARPHNCEKALVETTSWQAKPFYEKQGYRLMATLPDRPKGHASHYLVKSLV